MDFDKSFTIIVVVFFIMFFGMFWVLFIADAYINSPSEFTFKIETDNNTQRSLEGLNGSLIINNYYVTEKNIQTVGEEILGQTRTNQTNHKILK